MKTEKKKNNYLTGIVGALIGAIIASIPWIAIYVYGNMILSILAVVIALGALKGYQIAKGRMTKKVPIIIIVISLVAVSVSTLVIIPLLLLGKEGFDITLSNLQILYQSGDFMTALMKDYIISVIFTVLGISGVIAKIKGEVEDLED